MVSLVNHTAGNQPDVQFRHPDLFMDMTNPGVQKPHCVPLLLTRLDWTSSRSPGVPTPSTVVIDQPSHFSRGVMHCEKRD